MKKERGKLEYGRKSAVYILKNEKQVEKDVTVNERGQKEHIYIYIYVYTHTHTLHYTITILLLKRMCWKSKMGHIQKA